MKATKLVLLLGLTLTVSSRAQQSLVISSFSQNGVLVCTNLQPGTVASVEWASSLSGPWTNWAGAAGLDAVTVNSNATISVSVPMFYRVRGVAQTNATPVTATNGMVLIPAGSFTIGDIADTNLYGNAAPISVTVSAFYMDTNLVSYSQWQLVYNWATTNGYSFNNAGSGKAPNHPVQTVNWWDTVKWCNARSRQAGFAPVYYTDAGMTQIYTNGAGPPFGSVTVYANWTANGYRLPTEAEWEKAARGGLSGKRFPWGDIISESQANYQSDYPAYNYDLGPNGYNAGFTNGPAPYTSPVGSFAANGYGLYDMAGNVFEWCWDWYYDGPSYPAGSPYLGGTDPRGPVGPLGNRVLRGGLWSHNADYERCGCRSAGGPQGLSDGIGFRCVRGQ